MKDFLSTQDVAESLSVSRQHVANLVKRGRLPGVKRGGRILIPTVAWNEFLAEMATAAKANMEAFHAEAD